MADSYRENAGLVFFWGIMLCIVLALIVWFIG